MNCPKCQNLMEPVSYDFARVTVDRCTHCRGIWFKPGSLETLRDNWMSEFIDTGDPAVGKKYNEITDIDCPECGARLDRACDESQTHIWYETCPKGHGVYFDAGEFTDWKYDTLMDRFRDLFAKFRK